MLFFYMHEYESILGHTSQASEAKRGDYIYTMLYINVLFRMYRENKWIKNQMRQEGLVPQGKKN